MIRAIHKTTINVPQNQVAQWFREVLPHNYLTIHPKDHLELTTLRNQPLSLGSRFRLRENIGQKFYLSTIIEITELTETSFAFKGLFPYSLVNLQARFSLRELAKNETEVTAENYAGYDFPLLGSLFDKVLYIFLPYQVLKQHMKEENQGIKNAIEVTHSKS